MERARRSWLGPLAVFGLTGAGLLAAHEIDYRLVFDDPATRLHVLLQSGHSYLPGAAASALLGALAGLVLIFCAGWGHDARRGRALGFRAVFARLVTLQAVGFVAVEVVERLQAGVPAHHMWSSILPIGLVLQVATAAVGALVIALVFRAARRIAALVRARRAHPRGVTPSRTGATVNHPIARLWADFRPPRAPPLLLSR